jgi:dihydrofolate synthase/folylpolyglutamate synthase
VADPAEALRRVERAILARAPEHDIRPSLDAIAALVDLLGSPQQAMPVIHITGTNGKTSTARMIDALVRGFGLRTGRFTSPHLSSITERITLQGQPVSPERFVAAYEEVAPYLGIVDERFDAPLNFFEVLVAMAYATFADAPVDVAIVEVGLGGAWDATNVADGQVAVATPIALDHMRFLGPDIESIAAEKSGIIKPGAVAVLAEQPLAAAEILIGRAGEVLTLHGLGGTYDEIFLPLHGEHQAHNAACALAAVEAFLGAGRDRLDLDVVRAGFAAVTSPGRLEVVRRSPTILLDAAHNPAGARASAAAVVEAFAVRRWVGVVGAFVDKDVLGILEAFEPVLTEVVITRSTSPRAMPPDELAAVAVDVFGPDRVEVVERLDDALDAGVRLAEESGDGMDAAGVLVTGSVITVAEARTLLGAG